jgi:DNA-binding response OmpR family regulator
MNRRAVFLDVGASGPRAREGGALAASLTARGFTIIRLPDGQTTLEALAREPADLLVIDADSPALDLRAFMEALRGDARTASTMVVALASGDPRELPARREIALTLSKPIHADEASSRLDALVVTRQRAASNARELRGDLSQITFPDLLQLFAVNRATGQLSVDAPGRFGTVVLDAGEVKAITCGTAAGMKAFVRLLALPEGAFVFHHRALDSAQSSLESMALGPALFEATRQIDEIARLKPSLPESWTEVRKARLVWPASITDRFEKEPALFEVARLLDTSRTLGALLDASPLPDADLLTALDELRREGLVEVAGGSSAGRVEVLDTTIARALSERIAEQGGARVVVVVDQDVASADVALVRALGGVVGFVAAEGAGGSSGDAGTLAPVGTLALGTLRIELFAVPATREFSPLWAVFGAGASAALITVGAADGAGLAREVFATELNLPVGVAVAPWTASNVAAALRAALTARVADRAQRR